MWTAGVARQIVVKTCLLLLAGGLAAQHTTALPPYDVLWVVLVASICALAQPRTRLVAMPILGWSLFMVSGASIVGERLDPRYAGDSMLVRVRVTDFPRRVDDTVTMTVAPLDDARVPQRVRISWFEPPVIPRLGETWELELRLRRPRGSLNPGGFDVESWLFRERYHATGYVVGGKRNRLLWSGGATPIDRFRTRFTARARAATGSGDTAAVLAAIGVGARHLVSRAQWERFAETGTSHLMAISGLHVGIAALAGFVFVFGVAVTSPFRGNHYAGAVLLGVVIAGAYALVSGFGVPARRALIMLLLAAAAVIRRRQPAPVAIVATAAACVFVTDPVAALAPGFHLSFGAVVLLLWLARRRSSGRRRVVGAARQLAVMQVFLMFGLLPLTVLLFGRFAMLATPVNLVAVPVFSLVTVPATLAAAALGDAFEPAALALLRLAGSSVTAVDAIAALAADVPVGDGTIAGIEGLAWLLLGLPVAWVILPPSWPARRVAVLGAVALVAWKPPPPPAACFDAWVLDVGQGLAVAVRTAHDVMVYDTGMAWRSGTTAAEQVILPFLASRGTRRIERLVISHADLDHSGGTRALLRFADVGHVLAGEPLPGTGARQCVRGQNWWSGAIHFEVLHPPGDWSGAGNSASCVLQVSTGPHRLLLTGDIEARAERELLAWTPDVGADVVVVPHHGSRTSSSGPFVEAVAPAAAIVSAGYDNRWGLPVPQVVRRWEDSGATVLITAQEGAVSVRLCAAGGIAGIATERQRRRRFWHDQS